MGSMPDHSGRFAGALRRLRSSALDALRHRISVPTGVRVDDLRGQPHFAADNVHALIDVPLPAGTYHVNVRLGELQRRYTVTLEQGKSFDLYLRPTEQWR
jgi:hypothetical protein